MHSLIFFRAFKHLFGTDPRAHELREMIAPNVLVGTGRDPFPGDRVVDRSLALAADIPRRMILGRGLDIFHRQDLDLITTLAGDKPLAAVGIVEGFSDPVIRIGRYARRYKMLIRRVPHSLAEFWNHALDHAVPLVREDEVRIDAVDLVFVLRPPEVEERARD